MTAHATVSLPVRGDTLADLFEAAAFAVFSRSYELDGVASTYSRPVVAPGDSLAELLQNWLEALLVEAAAADLVFRAFTVDRLEEGGVQGSAGGMPRPSVVTRSRVVTSILSVSSPVEDAGGWTTTLHVALERPLRAV